ncbi:hypothetical protein [Salegentibacter salarius]|uniref:Uncharacterized protein n=1 Tax=Salegentibacter salarius TaxID=435906 RepID=A0A2N0TXD8_9FLAO|nr:hypothetical protein [Salegentibacter salarius]OEY73083.1 hypothetical protein BHS39_10775 [Salegentibacter salarius]PKD19366.1 hypothetical protein APR40_10755 [Salegentibacter salarius]SLJ99341.1 hypothetical protein SAMN05660445_02197 [Salegentibacter salarius]
MAGSSKYPKLVKAFSGSFLWRNSGGIIIDYNGQLLNSAHYQFKSSGGKFIKIRFKRKLSSAKKLPQFMCSWKMMTQVNCSLN